MRPEDYTGKEWFDLIGQLSSKQLKKALRSAYRKIGNPLRKKAEESLLSRGPEVKGNKADWGKAIRLHVYTRGGGFMVDTTPHRKKGFHRNRQGKEKPIVMWAETGTKQRKTRGHGFLIARGQLNRGMMKPYGFIAAIEAQLYTEAEAALQPELEKAVVKQAAKAGFI